ncbi:MAG: HD domain-containing protein, partial [Bacteroidota bacterium]
LIRIADKKICNNDPSHDLDHALRVLYLAEYIAKKENADRDIIVPAALFHDIICYPKNHRQSINSAKNSAILAKKNINEN